MPHASLAQAVNQINNRPRKCRGMKTPNQALLGINPLCNFKVEFKGVGDGLSSTLNYRL